MDNTQHGLARVTTDSVRIVENELYFYGSVRTHWRALNELTGYTLGIRYGATADQLDQELRDFVIDNYESGYITEPDNGDTVTCVFHCPSPLLDSCWYQAFVVDSWGNEYVSDTM